MTTRKNLVTLLLLATAAFVSAQLDDVDPNCKAVDKCPENEEDKGYCLLADFSFGKLCVPPPTEATTTTTEETTTVSGRSGQEAVLSEPADLDICSENHGVACDGFSYESTCQIANCEGSDCTSFDCVAPNTNVEVSADENSSYDAKKIADSKAMKEESDNTARSGVFISGLPMFDDYNRPLPGVCSLPDPFPRNCKPTRYERYGEEPPVNIPYCQRISCPNNRMQNLETNKRSCHSIPGCYFDYELYKYRQVFGQKLYPGVPVCHLAIRNKVFLEKAALAPIWTSYFTNCLINTFKKEINTPSLGCAMLPMLRAYNHYPKMAGWTNIQEQECIYIGGCWEQGRGCSYEIKVNVFKVRSQQYAVDDRRAIDSIIPYGRAKCQNFDYRNPSTILRSMHICLKSGCTVDMRAWSQYNDLFYYLGKSASIDAHVSLADAYKRGEVGPDNAVYLLDAFSKQPVKKIPAHADPNQSSFPFDDPTFSSTFDCSIGGRPCPPADHHKYGIPGKYVFPKSCPYKPLPFTLPSIGPLKGRTDSCCETPALCYLPKRELVAAHSGASTYYGQWTTWSQCDKSCGGGRQMRRRRCVADKPEDCTESLKEYKLCNSFPCPRWGPWGPYGPCSKTCGGGQQLRYRSCRNFGSNLECHGSGSQSRECNANLCPHKRG